LPFLILLPLYEVQPCVLEMRSAEGQAAGMQHLQQHLLPSLA
jgi:hypothetical protein